MGSGATPCHILYVEDHADTLFVLGRVLERHGHTVVLASDCRSAFELASNQKFDLLITDVGLPDGDGRTLLAQIRELYPIKGIILSGYGMANDIRASDHAGYDIHLIKPIDVEELTQAVNSIVPDCAEASARHRAS